MSNCHHIHNSILNWLHHLTSVSLLVSLRINGSSREPTQETNHVGMGRRMEDYCVTIPCPLSPPVNKTEANEEHEGQHHAHWFPIGSSNDDDDLTDCGARLIMCNWIWAERPIIRPIIVRRVCVCICCPFHGELIKIRLQGVQWLAHTHEIIFRPFPDHSRPRKWAINGSQHVKGLGAKIRSPSLMRKPSNTIHAPCIIWHWLVKTEGRSIS